MCPPILSTWQSCRQGEDQSGNHEQRKWSRVKSESPTDSIQAQLHRDPRPESIPRLGDWKHHQPEWDRGGEGRRPDRCSIRRVVSRFGCLRRQIARNFSIKPSQLKLPKLGLDELRDQVEFRDAYHMVKPKEIQSWEQHQVSFGIPDNMNPSIEHRKAVLFRMFPDVNCNIDASDFRYRSMWELPRAAQNRDDTQRFR